MAERLAGDRAVALLVNTLATIAALAPFSGAHFNPAVSLVVFVCRSLAVAIEMDKKNEGFEKIVYGAQLQVQGQLQA